MRKLRLLLAAFAASVGLSASAQTASAVGAGSYFLYNVGGAAYLTGGNNWGTHASLDAHGLYCTLAETEGGYTVNTGNGQHLGVDAYVDQAATAWAFEAVEGLENTYLLHHATLGYLVATEGSTDLSAVETAPTDNYGYWKLFTREALTEAAGLSGASETNPIDVTFLVNGANFVRNSDGWANNPGAKTNEVSGAWTYTCSQNNFVLCGPSASGQGNTGCEMWNNAFDLYQTITVPVGKYYVTCDGFDGSGNSYLYANDSTATFTSTSSSYNFANTLLNIGEFKEGAKTGVITVTDGTLKIGVKREVSGGWSVIDNIRLYCVAGGIDLSEYVTAYEDALAKAQAVEGNMETAVADALAATISQYGSVDKTNQSALEEAVAALGAATLNANNSITAYTNAGKYFPKIKAALENTNFYTQEAFDAYYTEWLAQYEANTLPTAIAATLSESSAYSTGWHSDNFLDDILLSTWTIGGVQCKDFNNTSFYLNTWSVEGNTDGSEFFAPFFEYWVADNQSLAANTIVGTMTGLKANTQYSFTIRGRVRQTNNQTKAAEAITMQVGEGTPVDISAGAQFNAGQFFIGNFSAVGTTDKNGTLTVTINVAADNNISWLSFYNCKYSEGEDLSAYIADYEFALNNAVAADGKPMDPNMVDVLKDALDQYGEGKVDETDKAALIAAKEALEAALALVNPSVAALACTSATDWKTTGNNGNFELNTWSIEGNSDGSNMKTPFMQNWIARGTPLTDADMSYTLTEQVAGYYKVTGLIRPLNEAGGDAPKGAFIFANDAIERAYDSNATACTNGVYGNPVVYGLVGSDGVLTIGVKVIGANVNWVSWKDFSVEYVGTTLTAEMAANLTEEIRNDFESNETVYNEEVTACEALTTNLTDDNYIAAGQVIEKAYRSADVSTVELAAYLAAAEEDAATKKLGFDEGEYAPYTNVVILQAIANAKAVIDGTSSLETQEEIDAVTTALQESVWTANASDVDAVYNGNFASGKGSTAANIQQYGWTRTNAWGQFMDATNNVDVTSTSNGTAYYNQPGSMQYGNAGIYTMPLNENTKYTLTFKYASQAADSNNGMTASVLNAEGEGLAEQNYEANGVKYTEEGAFVTVTVDFTTGAESDYVLTLGNSGNTVITDVSIVKAAQATGISEIETALGENAAIYNLQGVKLQKLQKGINIVNGKKLVVK